MRKWLLLSAIILATACERDDLCLEKPLGGAVVRFHNAISGQPAAVDSVAVYYEGENLIPATLTDSLLLPLPPDRDTALYVFEKTGTPASNPDTVRFFYVRKDTFISKACGFRMTYRQLHAQLITDNDNWIQQITVTRPDITDDTLAHIRIYH